MQLQLFQVCTIFQTSPTRADVSLQRLATVHKKASFMATSLFDRVQEYSMATKDRSVHFLDSKIPPERRAELSDNLKEWTSQNPRLAVSPTCSPSFAIRDLILMVTGICLLPPPALSAPNTCLSRLRPRCPVHLGLRLPAHRSHRCPFIHRLLRRPCFTHSPTHSARQHRFCHLHLCRRLHLLRHRSAL